MIEVTNNNNLFYSITSLFNNSSKEPDYIIHVYKFKDFINVHYQLSQFTFINIYFSINVISFITKLNGVHHLTSR